MPQERRKKVSKHFDIPDVSLFTEGNTFTGSENTFNFRISPDGDRIRAQVWYGMKCYDLSEAAEVCDAEPTYEGMTHIGETLDAEYEKYKEKLGTGEVEGRRTYIERKQEQDN